MLTLECFSMQAIINKRKAASTYIGVRFCKSKPIRKWEPFITLQNKSCYLGSYEVESDAAFAYDEAASRLKGETDVVNFATRGDYLKARSLELEKNALSTEDIESLDAAAARIHKYCEKLQTELHEKTAKLPNECEPLRSIYLFNTSILKSHSMNLRQPKTLPAQRTPQARRTRLVR